MWNHWAVTRIGKRRQRIEKDGGLGVTWDGSERPNNQKEKEYVKKKINFELVSFFFFKEILNKILFNLCAHILRYQ